MTIALYPASFDPITFGHIDIAERAAHLFREVHVGVFAKPSKRLLFSPEQRLELTRQALSHLENVQVSHYDGLTIDFARRIGATVMVRGLRAVSDFEWEMQLALANQSLANDIETVCLMTRQQYSFISSSIVKEIALNDGQIDHLAPEPVVQALRKLLSQTS